MNLFKILLLALLVCRLDLSAGQTDAVITNWVKCTGKKGYNSQYSDVQKVEYSTNYVYITSTSVPGTYTPGQPGYSSTYPWADCPYVPVAQPTFRMKIPRNPVAASSPTAVPMGTFGILLNGVSLYNADDGNTYNNSGVWHRNAYFFEAYSFDSCVGHASVGTGTVVDGLYHHHSRPTCFSTSDSSSSHSPLLGYAFDGFPIYGPYGYTNASDTTSAIKLLTPCYSTYDYTTNTAGARTKLGSKLALRSQARASDPESLTRTSSTR